MEWTVANMLTVLRLVLTPFFILAFILGRPVWAIVLFCVAGFTDLIDGTVARLLRQPSKGGALLDPLADKFLMESAFACLAITGVIPWWFFLLALARDVTIVGGIFYLERIRAKLPYRPFWTSKFATFFQLAVSVMALILWARGETIASSSMLAKWCFGIMIASTVLIVVSGFQYVLLGVDLLRQRRKQAF